VLVLLEALNHLESTNPKELEFLTGLVWDILFDVENCGEHVFLSDSLPAVQKRRYFAKTSYTSEKRREKAEAKEKRWHEDFTSTL
jgi:hypothetical protein